MKTQFKIILIFLFIGNFYCCANTSDESFSDQGGTNTSVDSTFENPILPTSGNDPWVIKRNGYYYFLSTSGSNFITIRKTKYMSDLGNASSVKVWSSSDFNYVWAPELHYIDNAWYLYFSAVATGDDTHRMYVLQNTDRDPMSGNWSLKGNIVDSSGKRGIDASVFEYEGTYYMVWSGEDDTDNKMEDICIAKMSNPWTLDGDRVVISKPTYDWEKVGNATNEGPTALFNSSGNLFLTYSASDCTQAYGYCLGLLSLKSGGNPLTPSDWSKSSKAVLSASASAHAFAPGHNGFFKSYDNTEDWIIYHARYGEDTGYASTPRMQKFTWNEDGTPYFGEPVPIYEPIIKPSGEY